MAESYSVKRYMMELRLMRAELLRSEGSPDYSLPATLGERQLCTITYALAYLRLAEEIQKSEGWETMVKDIGDVSSVLGEAMQAYEPEVDWDDELTKVNDRIERRLNADQN